MGSVHPMKDLFDFGLVGVGDIQATHWDEMVWNTMTEEQQLSSVRLFKDREKDHDNESCDECFEEGEKQAQSDMDYEGADYEAGMREGERIAKQELRLKIRAIIDG